MRRIRFSFDPREIFASSFLDVLEMAAGLNSHGLLIGSDKMKRKVTRKTTTRNSALWGGTRSLAPILGALAFTSFFQGCRFAQPPANLWHPIGMRHRRHCK